jgi:hypothetical protein
MWHHQGTNWKLVVNNTRKVLTPFYRNILKQDRTFHILGVLHFSANKNKPKKTDENYNHLRKMTVFRQMSLLLSEGQKMWDTNCT